MALSLPQLTLALFEQTHTDIADYVAGPNQLALDTLKKWQAGKGPWFLTLWGHTGTGKSHLIEGTVRGFGQQNARVMYLPLRETIGLEPALLDGLGELEYVIIDDVHIAAGRPEWERGLFSLFNQLHSGGGRLLVSSALAPQLAAYTLPDLKSRLRSGLIIQLKNLDDHDKQLVLHKRAERHGLAMSDQVGRYLISRLRRDMSELNAIFELIDHASLSAGREITIPFVREVLDID